CSSYAGKNVLF
nr:immunoglobulin light chain junction region [Macaca mulatta]MPO04842.1 immunoglobulin light chain junction region [Macaca mulatta]MPO04863.1 immunoglobulin light chain junction region [Macaca mulatta]MPO05173.1 immunoglobulin light chain junction region [Macaca mulatta]MPO05565.1 immunoglobulin light chain junction region [Macaca mulatta]